MRVQAKKTITLTLHEPPREDQNTTQWHSRGTSPGDRDCRYDCSPYTMNHDFTLSRKSKSRYLPNNTADGGRTHNPHLRKVMRYHCATTACAKGVRFYFKKQRKMLQNVNFSSTFRQLECICTHISSSSSIDLPQHRCTTSRLELAFHCSPLPILRELELRTRFHVKL